MYEQRFQSSRRHGRALVGICLLLMSLQLAPPAVAVEEKSSLVEATERYEFHSNFWINLHHFLFAQAKRPTEARLEGGRSLTRSEGQRVVEAVAWYRENLTGHSLLMNEYLYAVKRAMINVGPGDSPANDVLTPEHRAQLEAVAPIYRARYWPRHDHQNRSLFAWNEQLIRTLEGPVLDRIAALAQQPWPKEPIRVDLTWDANWAGAYCTTNPVHAVITSRLGGPDNSWPPGGWIELLFHEPSHAVIAPDEYAVATAIAAAAAALEVEPPDQLWHAILFYFSGTAVAEGLKAQGIDHSLLMRDEKIFARYQPALFKHMPAYITGKTGLDPAIRNVVDDLN